MGLVKIATPVPDYSGSVGGIRFDHGRAEVDEDRFAAEVAYCRARGYTVTDLAPAGEEPSGEGAELPKKSASTDVWRAYAVEHGMTADEANALSRDQLAERFTTTKESS